MTEETTQYLAEWVAKKYNHKYAELGSSTTALKISNVQNFLLLSWIEHLL